jgi:hypothetical protein
VCGPELRSPRLARSVVGLGGVRRLAWDDAAALFGLVGTRSRWAVEDQVRAECMIGKLTRNEVKWLAEVEEMIQVCRPAAELRRSERYYVTCVYCLFTMEGSYDC